MISIQVRNYRTQLEKKDQDISTLRENLTESASKVTQLNKKIRDAQDEAMECMKVCCCYVLLC